jgi:hypothetical protein
MEAYLAMLMEGNTSAGDLMDDEYYLFANEGTNPITYKRILVGYPGIP